MIVLQNNTIKLSIAHMGAEPRSLVYQGREYIWQGNPEFWPRWAPLLFPTIGPTPDGKVSVGGTVCPMPGNGFARDFEFTFINQTETEATFELQESEASYRHYPVDFLLRVTYSLLEDGYQASATISAKGSDIWYTFGWHPAFSLDINGGTAPFDSYSVSFDSPQKSDRAYPVQGAFVYEKDFLSGTTVNLSRTEADKGPYIFHTINARTATLTSSQGPHGVTIDMGEMKVLTVWTPAKHARFVCVEPVMSFGDATRPLEMEKMPQSMKLEAGQSHTYSNCFRVF